MKLNYLLVWKVVEEKLKVNVVKVNVVKVNVVEEERIGAKRVVDDPRGVKLIKYLSNKHMTYPYINL